MKVTTKQIEITPEMALKLLQINTRNRPLSKHTVLIYADHMTRGLWKFNGESIIISDDNVLLDGQNRLAAVVKSKTTQTFMVIEGIKSDTFDTIDIGKTRTTGDMLAIKGVPNYNKIAAGISAYYVLKNNKQSFTNARKDTKISKAEIVKEYSENSEFWQEVAGISSKLYSKLRLINQGTLTGYISFLIKDKKHSQEKVISFWTQLIHDTNIENITIPLLREKLLKSITGQYKLTEKYRYALIAITWNAYILGKELKKLTVNIEDELIPELI